MKLLVLLLFIPFSSCISKESQSIGVQYDYNYGNINCQIDSFYIIHKHESKYVYSAFYGGRNYFYNYTNASLDYLDYKTRQHVELFKIGEDLHNKMRALGIISEDSIAFVLESGIIVFDSLGNKRTEYKFGDSELSKVDLESNGYNPIIKIPDGFIYERYDKRKKDRQYIGMYSISKGKSIPVPISFPKISRGNAGLVNNFSYIYFNGKIGVLFNFQSDIYLYDIRQGATTVHTIKSKYDEGFQPFMGKTSEEVNHHFVMSGNYYKMAYNPFKKQIMAVYLHPQNLKNDADYYNQPFVNRKASLIIIDENFNHQKEYVFSTSLYALNLSVFAIEEGIIIRGLQTKEEYKKNGTKNYLINCP